MKLLLGLTELWCFPIMGEETWAGVNGQRPSNPINAQLTRRSDHVTSSQQGPQFP